MSMPAIPIALESPFGVVSVLVAQKFGKLGIAAQQLLVGGKPMIGQKIAPTMTNGRIDQLPEDTLIGVCTVRCVIGVNIEDDAGAILASPS